MKFLIFLILLFPSIAVAIDDSTVMAIDLKASSAHSKANGNNSRIQALETEDLIIHNRIDTIQLTPGPKGDKGDQGIQGIPGVAGKDGINGTNGVDGINGTDGLDGQSCTAIQGTGSATISCEDGTMASVYDGTEASGNSPGDMRYWDGSAWALIPAPDLVTDTTDITLHFCRDGKPAWACHYAIGDTGPAGGIVFYITDGGLHGLEAAPVDQGHGEWGCYGEAVDGGTDTAVGTGEQNTANLIYECQHIGALIAATLASSYGPGWFLPSLGEMELLYAQKDVVGGFLGLYYWTSTQQSALGIYSAMVQDMGRAGDAASFPRDSDHFRVRAINAF